MAEDWRDDPRRERRSTALRLVMATVVLGGAYAGLCVWSSQHVPASVSVGGIQVGGMTAESARAAIVRGSRPLLATPIVLSVPGRADPIEVVPRDAGLRVDADRSIDGLTGFTLSPSGVWERLTGAVEVPLLTSADDDALTRYVEGVAPRAALAPQEGRITFPGGSVTIDLPVPGHTLDVAATKFALRKAFPEDLDATAAMRVTEPQVSAETVLKVASQFASTAMSRPLTLVSGPTKVLLSPAEFAPLVSVVPDGSGGLVPHFDGPKLAKLVASKVPVTTRAARNAGWVPGANHGPPRLVPSVDGLALDEDDLVRRIVTAISGADRTVDVRPSVARPPFTSEDAQRAGVTTLVAETRSAVPTDDPGRATDLALAARRVDNTYVPPGGTFSLNAVLGEPGELQGDADGAVVTDGRVVQGTRGGVGQVSTVVYNLAYFAGVDVLERTPHAYAIASYPEGREASLSWPALDNRWRNDTPFGMLLQTWVEGGALHGQVWSTKTWDVRAVKGPRRNVVAPLDHPQRLLDVPPAAGRPRLRRHGDAAVVPPRIERAGQERARGDALRSRGRDHLHAPGRDVPLTWSRAGPSALAVRPPTPDAGTKPPTLRSTTPTRVAARGVVGAAHPALLTGSTAAQLPDRGASRP